MNHPAWNQYLKGLRPTGSGILALSLCLIILPLFLDMYIWIMPHTGKNTNRLSFLFFMDYLKTIPFYFGYLLVYYLGLNAWNSVIKILHIETLYFRS